MFSWLSLSFCHLGAGQAPSSLVDCQQETEHRLKMSYAGQGSLLYSVQCTVHCTHGFKAEHGTWCKIMTWSKAMQCKLTHYIPISSSSSKCEIIQQMMYIMTVDPGSHCIVGRRTRLMGNMEHVWITWWRNTARPWIHPIMCISAVSHWLYILSRLEIKQLLAVPAPPWVRKLMWTD